MFTASPLANSERAHPADALRNQTSPPSPRISRASSLESAGSIRLLQGPPVALFTPPKLEVAPPASLTGASAALPEQVQRQDPFLLRERSLFV